MTLSRNYACVRSTNPRTNHGTVHANALTGSFQAHRMRFAAALERTKLPSYAGDDASDQQRACRALLRTHGLICSLLLLRHFSFFCFFIITYVATLASLLLRRSVVRKQVDNIRSSQQTRRKVALQRLLRHLLRALEERGNVRADLGLCATHQLLDVGFDPE